MTKRDPQSTRVLLAGVIDAFGTGLFLPVSVLYFTREVGLSAVSAGVMLSIANGVGFCLVPVAGVLTDRAGASRIAVLSYVLGGLALGGYLVADSFWPLLAFACLACVAEEGSRPARRALISTAAEPGAQVALASKLAAARNAAFGVAGLAASAVLALKSRSAYDTVIVLDVSSCVIAAAAIHGLRETAIRPKEAHPLAGLRRAVQDHRYVTLAASNAVILLSDTVLLVALPLWVTRRTAAPAALAPLLFTLNTILAAIAQQKFSTRANSISGAGRAYRLSGVAFALAACAFAGAATVGTAMAITVLFLGTVLLTCSEMWGSAGEFGISLQLAPASARGSYLAVYGLSNSLQRAAGPAIVVWALFGGGTVGWLAMGAVVASVGWVASLLAKQAEVSSV